MILGTNRTPKTSGWRGIMRVSEHSYRACNIGHYSMEGCDVVGSPWPADYLRPQTSLPFITTMFCFLWPGSGIWILSAIEHIYCVCIQYVFVLIRCFWALVCLAAVAMFCNQMTEMLTRYFSFQKKVKLDENGTSQYVNLCSGMSQYWMVIS